MIPVLGLILFGIAWFFPASLAPGTAYGNGFYHLPGDGWMYLLWADLSKLPLWAQMAPTYLTAMLTAGLLVRTDMKNLLMGTRSYAIAYVFLFLLISCGHLFLFHPAFFAGFFMVLSYKFLLDLYKEEKGYSIVFAMGFSWGMAIILYPPVSLLVPAVLFGLLVMVTTNWRHWLVSFMGILLPAALMVVFWLLLGDVDYEIDTFLSWFKIRENFIPGFIKKEPFLAAWLGLILIWTVIASAKYRNPKIQSRQLFQANFLLFISILAVAVLFETVSLEIIWLLLIPLTYMMTFWALKVERGWKRELLFVSLILSFAFFRITGLI